MLPKALFFAAFLALVAWSSAFSLDDLNIDGIEAYLHHGEKRQASGTANTPTPPPPASSSARPPASSTPAPPPVSTPPTEPTSQAPTQDPPKSTVPAQSTPAQSTAANNQPSSPRSSAPVQVTSARESSTPPRTTAVVWTSALVSTSLQEFVTVITTISNGQEVTTTSTGTSSIPITTGQALVTDAPTSQNSSDNNHGLSKSDKNIIGGVVGGVGGVLLLGGIALVFLRMKKRQTRVHEDDDDMTLGTGSALGDKTAPGHGPTPFQSNLEQYHNPGGRPNAAANF